MKGIRRTGVERRADLSSWKAEMARGGWQGGKGTDIRERAVRGEAMVE